MEVKMNLRFPNPAHSTAEEIFSMEETHALTEDIECQRYGMIDYLDVLNYMNGNSFDGSLETRQTIANMALAMPSIAYINPHKTREMIYNLHLVCDNIRSYHLLNRISSFHSENMVLVQEGMAAALYRMVSGDKLHDEQFHKAARGLYDLVCSNSLQQHVYGVDTTRGRFEVVPNVMTMMIFELHDRFFGSRLSHVNEKIRAFICENLQNPETGLYYESYQTGSIGYVGENINPASAWRTNVLRASVNGLAITFMNYFDPENCRKAWEHYKEMFMESVLNLTAEEIADSVGCAYNTQLGPGSEDLLASLLAAKEMQDPKAFGTLQQHLFEIGKPHLWEGLMVFTEFGETEHLIGHYALYSRVHVGWEKLLTHDWETYYEYDYNEIR